MVSKFDKKFVKVSKLFEHAAHNGSNYLNGYCFVGVMLCVTVWNKNRIHYLSVPLGYRMYQKKESKLELTVSMVRQVKLEFSGKKLSQPYGCDFFFERAYLHDSRCAFLLSEKDSNR